MVGERGYVALLAVLIIGAAAVAISTTLLLTGVDSQRSTLVHQQAKQARALAVACAHEALQQIQDTTSFTGNNSLNLGQGSCTYTVTNTGGSNRTIFTTGTVNNVVAKIDIRATIGTNISVTSWQEVGS